MHVRPGEASVSRVHAGSTRRKPRERERQEGMTHQTPETDSLLTPAEVAAMFRVDPVTVTRWARAGKLSSVRTLGGHRRYRMSEVRALLPDVPEK